MHLSAVVKFLKNTDELQTAKVLLDTFAKYANGLDQYDELAMLYQEIKCYDVSLKMLHKCISMANNREMYTIRSNLAKVLNHSNDPHKALEYSLMNLEMDPNNYDTVMEISFSYYLMGNKEKSYQIQNELLEKDIDVSLKKRIMYNMGTFQMERGKFKEGIRNMIMGGRGIGIWPPMKKPFPKWDGVSNDKTLVIYGEAGIGDELINVRFSNELNKRNIKHIWVSLRKDLSKIFNDNAIKSIHSSVNLDPTEEYYFIEAMSLPIYLELEEQQLWTGAYLRPNQNFIDKWKNILPKDFITLRWSGNPYYDQDLHRFVDRDILVDRFAKFNLPMISLQIDKKNEDSRLLDVDIKSWEDTLAIQYLAKCNITSCTSTAHSAAAMNVNTIIIPPIATYYPWITMRDRIHSYWYGDKAVLFPQTEHKNWTTPVNQAAEYFENNIL
jgi:tetratricopeptide (TPR) repeat protein